MRDAEDQGGVVITGLAVISPLGATVKEFWSALTAGAIGTGRVTRFDPAAYGCANGGEVAGFEIDRMLPTPNLGRLPLSVQYAVAATGAALADAGLTAPDAGLTASDPVLGAGTGVCFGTVMGTRPHLERLDRAGRQPGDDAGWVGSAAIAEVPAALFGLAGPALVVSSGCSAGNDAIGHGYDLITTGAADCVVAGGAEELSEAVYALFTSLRALAPDLVRPFDLARAGILPAEGAAALVLESAGRARARGARVYARLIGYSCGADAHHLTAPHPAGRGLLGCLHDVLDRAGLPASSVDYVSAHGTGTPANDVVEAAALASLFGPDGPAVSSIKGVLGHAQGAASAIEAVSCVLAIRDAVVPGMPTVRRPDPRCAGVDLVVGPAREVPVEVAASVAFGFGGSASALLIGAAT